MSATLPLRECRSHTTKSPNRNLLRFGLVLITSYLKGKRFISALQDHYRVVTGQTMD